MTRTTAPACAGAALALALAAGLAFGSVTVPPPKNRAVSDYAGVILNEDARAMESLAREVLDRCDLEIVVVTIKSLEGEPIGDLAGRWAASWGVGGAAPARGLLLIVSVGDRESRIEPEGVFEGLIEEEGLPYFRRGDYSVGIRRTVERIAREAARDRGVALEADLPRPLPRSIVSGGLRLLVILASVLAVAAGLPALIWWRLLRGSAPGGRASGQDRVDHHN